MSAWSTGIFDDDEARDWLDELCTSDGTDLLSEAFAEAGEADLDAAGGCRILCAGAALAVALGHEIQGAPDLLKIWAAGLFEDDIRALLPDANAAVARVLAGGSELKALLAENPADYAKWEAEVRALQGALR